MSVTDLWDMEFKEAGTVCNTTKHTVYSNFYLLPNRFLLRTVDYPRPTLCLHWCQYNIYKMFPNILHTFKQS